MITTCFESLWSVLNVWKNSSIVCSLPCRNWMSSMRRTSTSRYRRWNSSALSSRIELMKSFVNSSLITYRTCTPG